MGRGISTSMRVGAGLVALSISLVAAQSPVRSESPAPIELPADPAELARLVDDAMRRESARDSSLDATIKTIVDGPALDRLDARRQHAALLMASRAAVGARELERAHALARRSTAVSAAGPPTWVYRFMTANYVADFDDALLTLTTIAERWPKTLKLVDEQSLARVASQARSSVGDESALSLLSALFDAKWRQRYRGEPSELWRELALLLLDEGDAPKAITVLGRITAATSIVRMRADRRFDSLQRLAPARFDVQVAAASELEWFRQTVRSSPGVIEPVLNLSNVLADNGRCDEALAIVEDTIAHALGPVPEGLPYRDAGQFFVWLLDARARHLYCLDRDDEAVAQRVQAAALTERGRPNVSQVINLAGLYTRLDRPREALDVLDALGEPSAFGKMQEQSVRLRAYTQLGDADGARSALAYMREHRADALASYQDALLYSGDLNGAAAVLIERIQDPHERADALFSVQRFGETADEAQTEVGGLSRWRALLAREDVRAAIDLVGRIEAYPFLY